GRSLRSSALPKGSGNIDLHMPWRARPCPYLDKQPACVTCASLQSVSYNRQSARGIPHGANAEMDRSLEPAPGAGASVVGAAGPGRGTRLEGDTRNPDQWAKIGRASC